MRNWWAISLCATCLLGSLVAPLRAQTSFGVDLDTLELSGWSDDFLIYFPIQLENFTGDTLPLRWDRLTLGQAPAAWTYGVTDPQNTFLSADTVDSAFFALPPVAGTDDKFLVFFYLEETPGEADVRYRLSAVDNPADSVGLTFQLRIRQPNTGLAEARQEAAPWPYPNPTQGRLTYPAPAQSLRLFDEVGRELPVPVIPGHRKMEVQLQGVPRGIYFLEVQTEGRSRVFRVARQ